MDFNMIIHGYYGISHCSIRPELWCVTIANYTIQDLTVVQIIMGLIILLLLLWALFAVIAIPFAKKTRHNLWLKIKKVFRR